MTYAVKVAFKSLHKQDGEMFDYHNFQPAPMHLPILQGLNCPIPQDPTCSQVDGT